MLYPHLRPVFINTNEEGDDYQEHDNIKDALKTLMEYPNDTITVKMRRINPEPDRPSFEPILRVYDDAIMDAQHLRKRAHSSNPRSDYRYTLGMAELIARMFNKPTSHVASDIRRIDHT